jgi:hypothetical protein
MLNHTLIKRTLASGLAIAVVGAPATAQAALMPAEGASLPAPAVNPTVAPASSSFHWGDAGIGAAGATVLLGAGALGAGATSRRRRRAVVG